MAAPCESRAPGKRAADDIVSRCGVKQARCLTEDAHVPIDHLPPNIIIKIFKYLPLKQRIQISLVSKFWYELVYDQDLWKVIQVKDMQKVDDSVLLRLTSLSNNVTHLDISGLFSLTVHGFVAVLENLHSLVSLKAYHCLLRNDREESSDQFRPRAWAQIGKYCHWLTYLNLDHCKGVNDTVLKEVAEGCPLLETLRISGADVVTSEGITAIAKCCPRLNYLYLDGCRQLDCDGLEALAESCPEVVSLCITGTAMGHSKLLCLGKFKKLQVLEMSNLKNLDEETMVKVAMRLKTVVSFSVSLNTAITDKVVDAIARYMPKLIKLNLVNCKITDRALRLLGKHSQNLEILDASWCQDLTDDGVLAIVDCAPCLRSLSLMRCDNVTNKFIKRLVKRKPHIHFSTMYLDYQRLFRKAMKTGCISSHVNNPFLKDDEDLSDDSSESSDSDHSLTLEIDKRGVLNHRDMMSTLRARKAKKKRGIPRSKGGLLGNRWAGAGDLEEGSSEHEEQEGNIGGGGDTGEGCSGQRLQERGEGAAHNGSGDAGKGCSEDRLQERGEGAAHNGSGDAGEGCSGDRLQERREGAAHNGSGDVGEGCSGDRLQEMGEGAAHNGSGDAGEGCSGHGLQERREEAAHNGSGDAGEGCSGDRLQERKEGAAHNGSGDAGEGRSQNRDQDGKDSNVGNFWSQWR